MVFKIREILLSISNLIVQLMQYNAYAGHIHLHVVHIKPTSNMQTPQIISILQFMRVVTFINCNMKGKWKENERHTEWKFMLPSSSESWIDLFSNSIACLLSSTEETDRSSAAGEKKHWERKEINALAVVK